MPDSFKNSEIYPIGTRVRISLDKGNVGRIGTVVEYTEDGEKMCVHWDGDFIHFGKCPSVYFVNNCTCGTTMPMITSGFSPMELKEVRE